MAEISPEPWLRSMYEFAVEIGIADKTPGLALRLKADAEFRKAVESARASRRGHLLENTERAPVRAEGHSLHRRTARACLGPHCPDTAPPARPVSMDSALMQVVSAEKSRKYGELKKHSIGEICPPRWETSVRNKNIII